MLQLTAEALQQRLTEGMRSGAMSDQSAAIGRLFSGVVGDPDQHHRLRDRRR